MRQKKQAELKTDVVKRIDLFEKKITDTKEAEQNVEEIKNRKKRKTSQDLITENEGKFQIPEKNGVNPRVSKKLKTGHKAISEKEKRSKRPVKIDATPEGGNKASNIEITPEMEKRYKTYVKSEVNPTTTEKEKFKATEKNGASSEVRKTPLKKIDVYKHMLQVTPELAKEFHKKHMANEGLASLKLAGSQISKLIKRKAKTTVSETQCKKIKNNFKASHEPNPKKKSKPSEKIGGSPEEVSPRRSKKVSDVEKTTKTSKQTFLARILNPKTDQDTTSHKDGRSKIPTKSGNSLGGSKKKKGTPDEDKNLKPKGFGRDEGKITGRKKNSTTLEKSGVSPGAKRAGVKSALGVALRKIKKNKTVNSFM